MTKNTTITCLSLSGKTPWSAEIKEGDPSVLTMTPASAWTYGIPSVGEDPAFIALSEGITRTPQAVWRVTNAPYGVNLELRGFLGGWNRHSAVIISRRYAHPHKQEV